MSADYGIALTSFTPYMKGIMSNNLSHYRILVADADQELAHVLRAMLKDMGFAHIHTTRSGRDAFRHLQNSPVDFVITEWNTLQMDGLELIRSIRRDPASPRPTLPVIMLTGRAEAADVIAVRDHGINEYVVKPFTARSIYNRLERIIEQPRPFVVAPQFVGPCRRHKGTPPEGVAERRNRAIVPKLQPMDVQGGVQNATTPKVWLPDFSLKYKLGRDMSLNKLITPQLLDTAQAAIDAISNESMQWVKENLTTLKMLSSRLGQPNSAPDLALQIGEVALTINSRAGTFGYSRAAEIAYMLYLFCRKQYRAELPAHNTIIKKHIEVLQVVFGNNMKGDAGAVGEQIVAELKGLIKKTP